MKKLMQSMNAPLFRTTAQTDSLPMCRWLCPSSTQNTSILFPLKEKDSAQKEALLRLNQTARFNLMCLPFSRFTRNSALRMFLFAHIRQSAAQEKLLKPGPKWLIMLFPTLAVKKKKAKKSRLSFGVKSRATKSFPPISPISRLNASEFPFLTVISALFS